jgi:hypothetical protein
LDVQVVEPFCERGTTDVELFGELGEVLGLLPQGGEVYALEDGADADVVVEATRGLVTFAVGAEAGFWFFSGWLWHFYVPSQSGSKPILRAEWIKAARSSAEARVWTLSRRACSSASKNGSSQQGALM